MTPAQLSRRTRRRSHAPWSLAQLKARTVVDRTTGCWLWQGTKNGDGYGLAIVNGRRRLTHRVAWETVHGPIPAGLFVLHGCDQPACIRWDDPAGHLHLGDHLENMREARERGRLGTGPRPFCRRGHPRLGPNAAPFVYVTNYGALQCRACRRHTARQRLQRTAA